MNSRNILNAFLQSGTGYKVLPSEKRNIWLTNLIALVVSSAHLFVFIYRAWSGKATLEMSQALLINSIVILLPIMLNRFGLVNTSRILLSWLSAILIQFDTLFVISHSVVPESSTYVGFRFFIIVLACIPLLIFNSSEKLYLALAMSVPVCGLLFYDQIIEAYGYGYHAMGLNEPTYSYNTFRSLLAFAILALSIYFLKDGLEKGEKINERLLLELDEKNKTIQAQAESELQKLNDRLNENYQKLLASEANLTATINNTKMMIWSFDKDLNLLACNKPFMIHMKERYGVEPVSGSRVLAGTTGSYFSQMSETWVNLCKRALKGESLTYEESKFNLDFNCSLNPIVGPDGSIAGVTVFAEDVTEQKRIERQQALYTSIVNTSDDAIFIRTDDGLIASWNQGAENIFGYTGGEIIGTHIDKLIPTERIEEKDQILEKIKRGETIHHLETVRLKKNGQPIHVSMTISPLKDWSGRTIGTSSIVRDISERIAASELLVANERRFRAMIEHSVDGIGLIDSNLNQIYQSPRTERILGYTLAERNDANTNLSIVHPEDKQLFLDARNKLTSTKGVPVEFQYRLRHKNGHYIWVEGVLNNLLHDPSVKAIVLNFRDITVRKEAEARLQQHKDHLEDEVQKRTRELTEARFAAEAANRTKSQFLANMSHEIRTPLNAVIGLSYLARKTQLTPKQEDYLQKIHSSSESLLGIINDILDFSKIEAGKLVLEEVNFNLEDVLQKLADVITYKAQSKGLEIAFGRSSNVNTLLVGDPVRLQQILNNLCSNAVKFTEKGEVVVMAKLAEETGQGVKLQFEVRDTGIGMDKNALSKLFTPFTQADDSISRKFGGTGLGLSIIKLLVELMQGTVWVESEPGKGSFFYFTAWFRKQEQESLLPVPIIDLQNLNVLLVDDNKSSLKILKEALESFSFEVTTKSSGKEAIQFLKENHAHRPVRLILMDWIMPEMDGLQAAEMIRQDQQFKDIRMIMLCTSYANEELYQRAEELGLAGILIKPVKYSDLYDTIIRAFDTKETKEKRTAPRQNKQNTIAESTGGHVLLVEDNEINQQVASELLEGFGFSVEIAGNGREALDKAKDPVTRFDLILMDIQMPIMGGYKATMEIRKLTGYKTTPIIAMTADAMEGVREKCYAAGMVDFITKPINPARMLEVLQKWFKAAGKLKGPDPTNKISQENTPIPKLKGINVEEGLNRVNGNAKLYHDLLIGFLDSHQQFVNDVIKDFGHGELSSGRRAIHTLKGTSSNLGMMKLYEITVDVETELKGPQAHKNIVKIIKPLKKELDSILDSLRKNLKRELPPSHEVSLAAAKPLLAELDLLLRAQDLQALKVLNKIGVVKDFEKQMEQVRLAIQQYNFDEARMLLQDVNIK